MEARRRPRALAGGSAKRPVREASPARQRPGHHHVGHSSVLIQLGNLNVLVDPVWSERASPVGWAGPKRVNAPGIAFADLPPIDAVLITHNHYDHLDIATLRRLWRSFRPRVIAPQGNDAVLAAKAIGRGKGRDDRLVGCDGA